MKGTNLTPRSGRAFTLIELLIVVAIIAILAAIAVPNLMRAQVRAKVARVQSDMRAAALALDAYFVDSNSYPRDHDNVPSEFNRWSWRGNSVFANQVGFFYLTTPVAYLTSLARDPFSPEGEWMTQAGKQVSPFYVLASGSDNALYGLNRVHAYLIVSVGPDQKDQTGAQDNWPSRGQRIGMGNYDPSNGTRSSGDIYRLGGNWRDGGDWELWGIPWRQWDELQESMPQ